MRKDVIGACMMLFFIVWLPLFAQAQTVRVTGSTTVKAFVDLAVKAYVEVHPDVLILVGGGGSGLGAKKLAGGLTDIAMMSRPAFADELKRFAAIRAKRRVIGLDGVVIAVSDEIYRADVSVLTREQAKAIWQGKIRNWKVVGGPHRPILPVSRVNDSGTNDVFIRWLGVASEALRPLAILNSNLYTQNLLAASDQAVGYLPFGALSETVHGIGIGTNEGVIEPTAGNIRSGKWPMRRELVIWLRQNAPQAVYDFADFLVSSKAVSLLQQAGYLPLPDDKK